MGVRLFAFLAIFSLVSFAASAQESRESQDSGRVTRAALRGQAQSLAVSLTERFLESRRDSQALGSPYRDESASTIVMRRLLREWSEAQALIEQAAVNPGTWFQAEFYERVLQRPVVFSRNTLEISEDNLPIRLSAVPSIAAFGGQMTAEVLRSLHLFNQDTDRLLTAGVVIAMLGSISPIVITPTIWLYLKLKHGSIEAAQTHYLRKRIPVLFEGMLVDAMLKDSRVRQALPALRKKRTLRAFVRQTLEALPCEVVVESTVVNVRVANADEEYEEREFETIEERKSSR